MHPRITIFLTVGYLICGSIQRSIEKVPHPSMEMGEIKPPNGSSDADTSESEVDVSRRWPSMPWKPRHHHTTTHSPTSQNAPLPPPLTYNGPKSKAKTRHPLRNKLSPKPIPDDIPPYNDDDDAAAKIPPEPPSSYPNSQSNPVFQKSPKIHNDDEQDGEGYIPWNGKDIEGIPVVEDDDADDQGDDTPSEPIPPVVNKRGSSIFDGDYDQDEQLEPIPPEGNKRDLNILDDDYDQGNDGTSELIPPATTKKGSWITDGGEDDDDDEQEVPSEWIPPVVNKKRSRILDGDDEQDDLPSQLIPPVGNKGSRILDGDDDTLNSDMDVDMNGGVPSVPKDTEYITVVHEKKCTCRLKSNRVSSIKPGSKGPDSGNDGEPDIDERNLDDVKKRRFNLHGSKLSNFQAPARPDPKVTEATKQILDDIGHWSVSCPVDNIDMSPNGPTILEGVKCTLVKEGPVSSMGPSATVGEEVEDNGDQIETLERNSYGRTSDEDDEYEDDDERDGSRNGKNYVLVQRKGGREQDIMQTGPRTMDDEGVDEEELSADK